jgi:hypothetical protein
LKEERKVRQYTIQDVSRMTTVSVLLSRIAWGVLISPTSDECRAWEGTYYRYTPPSFAMYYCTVKPRQDYIALGLLQIIVLQVTVEKVTGVSSAV